MIILRAFVIPICFRIILSSPRTCKRATAVSNISTLISTQQTFTYSKSTTEALEKGVKYVQS